MRLALPDESATARLARALAGCLSERDLVLLAGDLGAGKTTFVQHAAAALGCLEPVRSPTYTVAHQYELPGGATLAHLDLYRQAGDMLGAEAWGDIEPYFDSFAAFVEWPAVAAVQLAGRRTWRIDLALHSLTTRVARVTAPDHNAGWQLLDRLLDFYSPAAPRTGNLLLP